MKTIEFKPNLFSPVRVISFLFLLLLPCYFLFVLLPKIGELSQYPELSSTVNYLYLVIGISCLIPLIFQFFLIRSILSKTIRIEGELMYILDKSLFGSQTTTLVHLKDVTKVGEKVQTVWVGKSVMSFYWWVVYYQQGKTDKIQLSGWDRSALKRVIFYLKDINPKIVFDTSIYRDSSEKLSGLADFLK